MEGICAELDKSPAGTARGPRTGVWHAGCGTEGVTVVSWGGSYEEACRQAVFEPFSAETGIEVHVESFNGGLAQVRAQVETGNVHWDIVDLEFADVVKGCDEGLFEVIDIDEFPPARMALPLAMTTLKGPIPSVAEAGPITRPSSPTTEMPFLGSGHRRSRTSSTSASSRAPRNAPHAHCQSRTRPDGGRRAN